MAIPIPEVIRTIDEFTKESKLKPDNPIWDDSLKEQWYSAQLKRFLSPSGPYGFKDDFVKGFIKKIAKIRTEDWTKYEHKGYTLTWHGKSTGQPVTGIALKDAMVHLDLTIPPNRFDIVIDDPSDKIIVVVENKVFTVNSRSQLESYFRAVMDDYKYKNYRIREFVYLTLLGSPPTVDGSDPKILRYWVQMSWGRDILDILNELSNEQHNQEIENTKYLLKWFNTVASLDSKDIKAFKDRFLEVVTGCFYEVLNLLKEKGSFRWENPKIHEGSAAIEFTPKKKFRILVSIDPKMNLRFSVKEENWERAIQHTGRDSEQLYKQLVEIAKEIYDSLLVEKYFKKYTRLDKVSYENSEVINKSFLDFVCKYDEMLKTIFLYYSVYGK